MDLPEVLATKDDVIEEAGARASCERHKVKPYLRQEARPETLLAAGYRPEWPSVWLVEGLLFYLIRPAVQMLLEEVGR